MAQTALTLKFYIPPKIDEAAIERVMEQQLQKVADRLLFNFEKTTRTWSGASKPYFFKRMVRQGSNITIVVGTLSEIYLYVSGGTKPHMIYPVRAKALRFRSQFRPKTRPNQLASWKGFKGGAVRFAQQVHHPGTEARNFPPLVVKATEREISWFYAAIRREIEKHNRKASKVI